MPERSHLSIGEVLSLLREEFPDVTISKIRFLESQGLVDPERTPSGYRKFYDHDVERLRWILRQQRENFLPLKVIRGRLTEHETGEPGDAEDGPDDADPATGTPGAAAAASGAPAAAARGTATAAERRAGTEVREKPVGDTGDGPRPVNGPARNAPPTPSLFAALHAGEAQPPAGAARPGRPAAPDTRPPVPGAPGSPAAAAGRAYEDEAETYTVEELAGAAGAETTLVQELKQYGLIGPHAVVAGVAYYDASALAVTRAAAEFARHGVEARHLRPWRNAADREADLFQQVVLPLLRQRNPQARRQALDTLDELSAAGAALRAALVERAVREIH